MSNITKYCADCALEDGHSMQDLETLDSHVSSCYKCGRPVGPGTGTKAYLVWKTGDAEGDGIDITAD